MIDCVSKHTRDIGHVLLLPDDRLDSVDGRLEVVHVQGVLKLSTDLVRHGLEFGPHGGEGVQFGTGLLDLVVGIDQDVSLGGDALHRYLTIEKS